MMEKMIATLFLCLVILMTLTACNDDEEQEGGQDAAIHENENAEVGESEAMPVPTRPPAIQPIPLIFTQTPPYSFLTQTPTGFPFSATVGEREYFVKAECDLENAILPIAEIEALFTELDKLGGLGGNPPIRVLLTDDRAHYQMIARRAVDGIGNIYGRVSVNLESLGTKGWLVYASFDGLVPVWLSGLEAVALRNLGLFAPPPTTGFVQGFNNVFFSPVFWDRDEQWRAVVDAYNFANFIINGGRLDELIELYISGENEAADRLADKLLYELAGIRFDVSTLSFDLFNDYVVTVSTPWAEKRFLHFDFASFIGYERILGYAAVSDEAIEFVYDFFRIHTDGLDFDLVADFPIVAEYHIIARDDVPPWFPAGSACYVSNAIMALLLSDAENLPLDYFAQANAPFGSVVAHEVSHLLSGRNTTIITYFSDEKPQHNNTLYFLEEGLSHAVDAIFNAHEMNNLGAMYWWWWRGLDAYEAGEILEYGNFFWRTFREYFRGLHREYHCCNSKTKPYRH